MEVRRKNKQTNKTNSMSNVTIPVRTIEKNNIRLTPVKVEVKRGASAGVEYVAIQIPFALQADGKTIDEAQTLDSIIEFVKFRGVKAIGKALNSMERMDALQALEFSAEFEESQGVDPETGKPVDIRTPVNIDVDKFYAAYASETMRGGVTIKQLQEDLAEVVAELQTTILKMVQSVGNDKSQLEVRCAELANESQNLQAAIDARKREPRKK
jgi:hypothetical protein